MATMVETRVRPIRSREIPQVQSVIERANAEFRGLVPDAFFEPYLASALDIAGRLRHGDVLIAESAGSIVGSITFFPDANDEGLTVRLPDGTAGIRATAVAPEARGFGIGRRLVDACIERAEAAAADRVALHTATFMAAAMRLYERAGFERVPDWDFPAADFFGGDSADAVIAIGYARAIG